MSEEKSLEARVSEFEAEVADLKRQLTQLKNGEAINGLRSQVELLSHQVSRLSSQRGRR